MLPHTREVELHVDACRTQHVRRPDTAQHQHVRAPDRATREDDLLVDLDGLASRARRRGPLDARRGEVVRVGRVEHEARDSRVREDVEVRARRERVDVAGARVRARPVRRVDGEHGDVRAPVLATIRVRRGGDTEVLECGRPVPDNGRHAAGRAGEQGGATRGK